ncbi:metal-sulfur cluster assembly factor [Deinococcus aluminii]|uniref:MIP18 family-like domain-containing protein n=1 Tax=Deinococcus aluminii TaxID=1656885 RepID=A0ABP9XFN3_9DEIO
MDLTGTTALPIAMPPAKKGNGRTLDDLTVQATPTEKRLWHALTEVTDPEYPISVVDMGLIYGVREQDGAVNVDLTFTSMGCPCMEYIISDIRERLLQEPDVQSVDLNVVWTPAWTRQRLTEAGRAQLAQWGVGTGEAS